MRDQQFYAHSHKDPARWQTLAEHLRHVANLARDRAERACPGVPEFADAAELAGLLHDLGKYRTEFQQYLRSGGPRGAVSTRHKQAGAAQAYAPGNRVDLAFAIAGHHGGLPGLQGLKELIEGDGGRLLAQALWPQAVLDCPSLTVASGPLSRPPWLTDTNRLAAELQIRLLFSCLVDADWMDTASAMADDASPDAAAPDLHPSQRLDAVLAYIRQRAEQCRQPEIRAIRQEVLQAALAKADSHAAPAVFSMAVPTGGGKTLTALAFALAHAARYGLRRIIYVAPYLSILDQNARVLREALQADQAPGLVLEHHSLAEPPGVEEGQEDAGVSLTGRLAENWDVPVVLTTSVQFFQSLFAAQPSRCRKLHNIARSVVILDECQTLPPGLIAPTCQMLESFSQMAGCSIVLCTATQPAWGQSADLPTGLTSIHEIAPPELDLYQRLRRVRIDWPAKGHR